MNIEEIIDISYPTKEFQAHLDLEDNFRILFSGPFGSGKTFFLNSFFKEKCFVFHLYPVNYSVSSNEDIFELIKFDILFRLLSNGVEPNEEARYNFFSRLFLKLNDSSNSELANSILSLINATSVPVESYLKFCENIEKLLKKAEVNQNQVKDFYLDTLTSKGGAYEYNNISKLISDLLSKIKENGNEVVLIIDDLDRIDPEHLFRLLNIFSVHLDEEKAENKFGFDRVVFVCDIENVRNIFNNKYGQSVDFSGYIDKFYSRQVFYFDNSIAIKHTIRKILSSVKLKDPYPGFKLNQNHAFQTYLIEIILKLMDVNCIQLRGLIKFYNREYRYKPQEFSILNNNYQSTEYPILQIFEFLLRVTGNTFRLFEGLEKLKELNFKDLPVEDLLLFVDIETHKLVESVNVYNISLNNKVYSYQIDSPMTTSRTTITVSKLKKIQPEGEKADIGLLLYKAAEAIFIKYKIIR